MAEKHWALLDITSKKYVTGFEFILTTDVPCHLFMRWTLIVPKQHSIPVYRRGLAMHADKYFCFDVYTDNEQKEDGDTLIHTFHKKNWPICQTRYFYFHGNINGIASPSTTAIFEKHRTEEHKMYEKQYTAHSETGWCPLEKPTWPEVHDGSAVFGYETTARLYLWAAVTAAPLYYIRRVFLRFDTSDLPADATIIKATISIYAYTKRDWGNPEMHLVSGSGLGQDFSADDYLSLLANTALRAPVMDVTDIVLNAYNDFELNAKAMEEISLTQRTIFGVKTSFDNNNEIPIDGSKETMLEFGGSADGHPPKLEVWYVR